MYKSAPINTKCVIEHYPTVMYKVKSVYGDIELPSSNVESGSASDASLNLVNLNKDSQSQLRRLNRLQDKVNQFCEDLSLGHLVPSQTKDAKSTDSDKKTVVFPGRVTTKKNASKKFVEDFVVHVSCNQLPYALLVAFSQLATKFKCFIQFFTHGTAVKELRNNPKNQQKIDAVKELFHSLKLDLVDARSSYDYGISFVWKKFDDEKLAPILVLSTKTKIYGESNIVRFINRLVETKPVVSRDLDLMDKCTNELIFMSKQDKYLGDLNKYIQENSGKFLTSGEKSTMVDFYLWSVLKQLKLSVDEKKFAKVTEWMKLVELSCPMLKMLNSM